MIATTPSPVPYLNPTPAPATPTQPATLTTPTKPPLNALPAPTPLKPKPQLPAKLTPPQLDTLPAPTPIKPKAQPQLPAKPAATQPDTLPPRAPAKPKPKPPTKPGPTPNTPAPQPTLPTPNPAHELGRRGEDLVATFVKTRGLTILCRNWRCREGELDILATDGDMLVVCEVKTRTSDEFGTPADAMNAKKIRHIKDATNRWLREYRVPYVPVRYDLAEVWWPPEGKPHIQYRRDAF
jgi:putative endonuclease